ncbi:hypothetical protein [Chitinophaga nivalis]|uniref:DUF4397 domain-containing protein n=1 Tax=Chitinophaga nivalis TaxID=2991709 RepID=A0ABT3INH9_9BACT|nr:hypothetical protein [Chitinophaga nivalis]MCW3464767.1 hypothetical protein [Chitinophaga nivalis]MCW3485542.1 hypothetical protein [Chitinophaga nivalis]
MFQFSYKRCFKACVLAGGMLMFSTSCKKELPQAIFPASLTIVNGVNDNTSFLTAYFGNAQPKYYNRLSYIGSGNSYDYATDKMEQPVTLFRNNDTLQPGKFFLKTSLQLEPGGIFTQFVYGSPTQVKQKTIKEQLPPRSLHDSVAHLRIINLFDNRSIDVVQLEPVAVTMVTNLAYEQLSDFIKVPVNASVKNFRFAVKDHATGVALDTLSEINISPGSTTLSVQWLFKARTMLVTGTWTNASVFSARAKSIGHF